MRTVTFDGRVDLLSARATDSVDAMIDRTDSETISGIDHRGDVRPFVAERIVTFDVSTISILISKRIRCSERQANERSIDLLGVVPSTDDVDAHVNRNNADATSRNLKIRTTFPFLTLQEETFHRIDGLVEITTSTI